MDAQQNPIGDGFDDADGTESHRALIRLGTTAAKCPTGVSRTWAREFRYDSPRQRYLTRELSTSSLLPVSDRWTDYLGDSPIADYEVNSQIPTDQRRYLPGVAETDVSGAVPTTVYLHGDLIGSTTAVTDDPPAGAASVVRRRVYTAFGELVEMTGDRVTRYGYAGGWGYQEHDADGGGGSGDGEPDNVLLASPTDGFPFLHLGARYYDPALGRFLQRDPIGIDGGLNVYAYVENGPTRSIDPSGLVAPAVPTAGALDAVYIAYESSKALAEGAEAWASDAHRQHIVKDHARLMLSCGDYVKGCKGCKKLRFRANRRAARKRNKNLYPHFPWRPWPLPGSGDPKLNDWPNQ